MSKLTLSANALLLINAFAAGASDVKAAAEKAGVTVPVVTGNLNTLKKNELITTNKDGSIKLTAAGRKHATVPVVKAEKPAKVTSSTNPKVRALRTGTKAEKGRAICDKMYAAGSERKDIIAALVKDADLTDKGAATYLQNYKRAHGLIGAPRVKKVAAAKPAKAAAKKPSKAAQASA